MKTRHAGLLLAVALCAPGWAQSTKPDTHAGHAGHAASAGVPADTDYAQGEIRRLDAEAGTLTIRHGEIRSLDMPPMTMVFGVKDKAMLGGLKAGDKLRFKVVDEGGGKLTITELAKAP